MAKPSKDHIHTYERFKKGFYRCVYPTCNHFTRRELLPNKLAMCKCGREYFLTYKMLQLKTPHCDECTKTRNNEQENLQEVLKTSPILKDLLGV